MMEIDLSLNSVSLVAALGVSAYLVDQCITPPNPAPSASIEYGNDSMQVIHKLELLRPWAFLVWFLHYALILFPHNRESICLNPDLLNEDLYTWNKTTIIYVLVILVAATSRVAAYAQLGKNFTYRLATPSGLIKTGFYAYVQHPSYTALLAVASVNGFTMLRFDGTLACLLPRWISSISWHPIVGVIVTAAAIFGLYCRVRDEETMMKKEFGKEWEDWNKSTKKFIPFII
ncbi:unnamed protein product [Blumeria hordei]|uniref:Protein-S-isoprenylcysteine O-methyltransferase n=2 Tax=Blumeria hordei TaxID=2867405 RepID=A0A383UP57_BLUHO|nr:prenyl cysteine carboxyl methyltransferase [Blumeria hordei DH14]SZF02101.1 unnamed protein product [Blumeria hordei]